MEKALDPPSPGCTGAEAVLSLQPNSSIPVTYHPLFGPHDDLILLEVDQKLLPDVLHQRVTVRGQPDEDAVLCTESKTYAMKSVGTSNSVFLIPPCGQYTTFESPKCCDENYHDPQSVASVIKVATGNMELVEVAPRLDKLRLLLSQNPYRSDEDIEMVDLEEMERTNTGLYRWNDLIEKVQASDYELRTALQALSAVEINGYWRIVDEKYMGTILRMLLHNSVLNDWSLSLLNQDDVVNMLESDGFPRNLADHCLHLFGSKVTEGATTSRVWKLDERKVCVHFAREILRDGKRKMKKFMEEWVRKVPEGMAASFDILEGEVLIERVGAETWIRAFSVSSLPYNPAKRFSILFQERPKWEWKDLQPFISESGNLPVASGIITDISQSHVSVSFSKHLRLPWSNPSSEASDLLQEVWRVDKDDFMTSFSVMKFNLVQLFLQSTQAAHLSKMIVDLDAPRFDNGSPLSQDPAISYVWSQRNLNDDQRRAILKILTAKDYALILGMPGTGKTSTMVHAVKALLFRGSSILLTSYTNSAVDNLLVKLKAEDIDFIRIGRHEAVHEEIRDHCFSEMNIQSVEGIKLILDQVKVVAITCLGITSPLLANKRFDVCIMDEAGQTTLPVSLGPLMFASKFVLVGDHYQLPPLVKSTEARENGMGVSLFCRLSEAHPRAISAWQSQYHMCRGITELSNALIYGDRLHCGSPEIENGKLKVSGSISTSLWIQEVINPSKPVIFINTDSLPAFEEKGHKIVSNPTEANIIVQVVEGLVKSGIKGEDIGVITPYNSQADIIWLALNRLTSVEVHTIDKYQGRDKDCTLVSFVRSTENPTNCSSSLLGDWHRINLALTCAKKKLIMVGSCKTLLKVVLMNILIEQVEQQSGILNVSNKDIKFNSELRRCAQSQAPVRLVLVGDWTYAADI